MKKVRLFAALLLLGMVFSTGYLTTRAQGDWGMLESGDGCGKCSCYTPNTQKYGTKAPADSACTTCDCYVPVL